MDKYAKSGQSFFLAVGLYRPHTPYVSPKKYFSDYPFEELKVPTVPDGYLDTLPKGARQSLTRNRKQVNLPSKLGQQAMQAYYASISFADAQVGRILDALEGSGLADNTIVVFTSDHGYHMGEHGHWQKTTLYENANRVPLIIARPKEKTSGARTKSLAEMVDIYPTLAELCQLKAPAGLAGVSLAPLWKDHAGQVRESALTQYANGYSLRTDRHRYTEWADGGQELYDHESDPQELTNLANRRGQAELVEHFSRMLSDRRVLNEVQSGR